MKAKDLIRVLQVLDPEISVSFSLGRDDEYRMNCAKAEIIEGKCLGYLSVDRIEFYPRDDSGTWADIVLLQDNTCDISESAKEFDEKYKETQE